ncbi:hypothetical protein [Thermincola potens]|nr:hypothetical protein [Thermincola potens]
MPRLPSRSDCASKTAAGQAGSSRMSEDGEGRREVRPQRRLRARREAA